MNPNSVILPILRNVNFGWIVFEFEYDLANMVEISLHVKGVIFEYQATQKYSTSTLVDSQTVTERNKRTLYEFLIKVWNLGYLKMAFLD